MTAAALPVKQKKQWLGTKGYTLVELMVVVTIMAILAAAATGIYHGYVERAKQASLYQKGHQVKEALMICEMEYMLQNKMDESIYWDDAFLLAPSDPDSILYPYVGEITKDCVDYTLKIEKLDDGQHRIKGFVYETDEYTVKWIRDGEMTVEKKE